MYKTIFLFILFKSLSAVADLHQSCMGNFYVHVLNKNKVSVFLGSSGFKENSNEKIFVYSADVEDKKFIQHAAPKRPKSLVADIHTISYKNEKYTVVIGL